MIGAALAGLGGGKQHNVAVPSQTLNQDSRRDAGKMFCYFEALHDVIARSCVEGCCNIGDTKCIGGNMQAGAIYIVAVEAQNLRTAMAQPGGQPSAAAAADVEHAVGM